MSSQPPFFEPDHAELRERVRAWAAASSAGEPGADVEGAARALLRGLGEAGLLRFAVPDRYGGARRAVSARDLCIIREELARQSALADSMFAVQALGSYPISLCGSEAQKAACLPPVAAGDAIAAFALTEPEAGSDAASLQTRAVRRDGGYVLQGTKRLISNAGIADTYVVFASTDPARRAEGISAFVVPARSAGLRVTEKTRVISPHPIGTIVFKDCAIPESALLGKEGEGLKIAFATLELLRCTVGAAAVGLGQRALEEALGFSGRRRQFGRALAEFQATQFKLAEMATALEAARLMVYQAAWTVDSGLPAAKLRSSMAKLYATETAQGVIDQALQIHGGSGVVVGSVVERLYRDIRALRIYEGTSEIQKIVIARELLKTSPGARPG
ncbi:MAG TPA: acyl-CoA dehydrogenase family protein [candidate division Zixibacteria bacterium]|nr:acyl-CoA dehydrogenase family protein [candidate division Zixibacteria bacterium]